MQKLFLSYFLDLRHIGTEAATINARLQKKTLKRLISCVYNSASTSDSQWKHGCEMLR